MLNPEMTTEIEEILYVDSLNIYSTYLDPDGSDYLHLPAHISQGMQESTLNFICCAQNALTNKNNAWQRSFFLFDQFAYR